MQYNPGARIFPRTRILLFVFACTGIFISFDVLSDEFPPSYIVHKTTSSITIDGKLDEECWAKIPEMKFLELQHGSLPPWPCYGKMLWDNDYFYIGFHIDDPDVWASLEPGSREPGHGDGHSDEYIITNDGFGKIFFDPDGDGKNYVEVHVNALNKVDDGYLEYPYLIKGKEHGWKTGYDYDGLKTAVFVDGTVNDQSGVFDKGWSIEAAFPWECLEPFIKGNCPPDFGDTWRAHIGRVWKRHPGGQNYYYTWPVIGFVDCHILNRWGYIAFAKEIPEIEY